jgi:2-dehydro-3-deoxyphosphogluconate aldolase/(4S)-4-hydroxy-2-oxoglutarate aldolase
MTPTVPAGIVAVVRAERAEEAMTIAAGVARGGVDAVEITFTVPGAASVIAALRDTLSVPLGAGTVVDVAQCAAAAAAGATFVVAPDLDPAVVDAAHMLGLAAVPGALTPSEVGRAVRAGADAVKLFPVGCVGGPAYVRALRDPFPAVRWVVSGGVRPEDVPAYRELGCHAICIGGALIDRVAARAGDVDGVARTAARALALAR